MKFTMALLVVLAVCQAAPEPKKVKTKPSESNNEKRALSDNSYEDTAYFKSVLRSIDPEIDFADGSEEQSEDHKYEHGKISDVLSGDGQHFHATIAGQLYSPNSPYQPKYAEEGQSNDELEGEQENEEEERKPAPKKKSKKQKSKSKHSSHHEKDHEKDHDDYDHHDLLYPPYGGLHHGLFGPQIYPGLGLGLDPRLIHGRNFLNPYLYPNVYGRGLVRPFLGPIPPHPLIPPHLALRNPLLAQQLLLNQGLTNPLQYYQQQGYEQNLPGVTYAQNAQEVNAQGVAANGQQQIGQQIAQQQIAQQQIAQQQIGLGQQQIGVGQQQIGLVQQQPQVQVPQQNYNAQATQQGAVSYATFSQNVPSPFIQVYGAPQEPQPQLEIQELPSLRPLPNFQAQIVQSEGRPIQLTQGVPVQQQSLPLVRIPAESRSERQQLSSPRLLPLRDATLEAQPSSPAPTIQPVSSSQSVTIEPLEQESSSTPLPQVTEQTPRPEVSSTPAPEVEGNFINVPDQAEVFSQDVIVQQANLVPPALPTLQYYGNYAESLFP